MPEQIQTPKRLTSVYTYIKLLGEGANGKTWLSKARFSDQLVAIKELKLSAMQDLKALELIKREVGVLASIKVKGVPKLYNSFFPIKGDDTCYIIQEYIPYPSILSILNDIGKFSEADTLSVLYSLVDVIYPLQMNYAPPIIHRDIKPSNILCQKQGGKIQLALIDFGAVANPQKRTGGSTIAGTFGYMAPEQLLGECTIQSDYYAIGATALHMLTGVFPYNMPSDVFRLDYKPTLREKAPETSEYMIELLDFLLAEKPADRPSDASELRSAISNVISSRSPRSTVAKENKAIAWNPLEKLRLHDRLYSPHSRSFLTTPDDRWLQCTGTLRGARTDVAGVWAAGSNVYEYTFEYQNKTYVGMFSTDVDLGKSLSASGTAPCCVRFNPADPNVSMIGSQDND